MKGLTRKAGYHRTLWLFTCSPWQDSCNCMLMYVCCGLICMIVVEDDLGVFF